MAYRGGSSNTSNMHQRNGGGAYAPVPTSSQQANYLEQENDQMVEHLSNKVSALKSLTIDIGNEVRDQNRLLNDMDSDFDSSRGLLGSTMRRLGIVSKAGGHKMMCYLVMFALLVFLIIWFLTR